MRICTGWTPISRKRILMSEKDRWLKMVKRLAKLRLSPRRDNCSQQLVLSLHGTIHLYRDNPLTAELDPSTHSIQTVIFCFKPANVLPSSSSSFGNPQVRKSIMAPPYSSTRCISSRLDIAFTIRRRPLNQSELSHLASHASIISPSRKERCSPSTALL